MHLNIQNVTFHLINLSTILILESRYTILYTNWLIKIKHVNSGSTDSLIYYCFGVIDVGPKDWWPLCSPLHWFHSRFVPQQISVWGLCILLFLPTNPSVLQRLNSSSGFGVFPLVLSQSGSELQSCDITPMSRTWGLVRDSASLRGKTEVRKLKN